MVEEFEFPDTGEGVTEGKFLEWKINEGDAIEEDQVVGEAETDKAVVEIPSPYNGKATELLAEPGDTVKVGETIMKVETEESSSKQGENTSTNSNKENIEETKNSESSQIERTSHKILALPKVRKLAVEKGIKLEEIKDKGRVTEKEVLEAVKEERDSGKEKNESNVSYTSDDKEVMATPSVRKLAREKKVDLTQVPGTGRGGKITREDVLNAASNTSDTKEKSSHKSGRETDDDLVDERKELSQVRKSIAKTMTQSKFSAPHVAHIEKVDVTKLVELRNREKDKLDVHLTYLPFIMKAALQGLREYPELNAEYDEESQEVILKKEHNFNIAVDTENGLMVPVIDKIDEKSIVDIAEEIEDAVKRARNQKVTRKEMNQGTFSITNIGVIGGEAFTPIINPPQTAILGIGAIKETAEVVNGEVTPRHTVYLSLSYDHRVIDGATAARFTNTVKENLENPEKLLMRL